MGLPYSGPPFDKATPEVKLGHFDALIIPGGYAPDKLRIDDQVVRFVTL